VNEFLGRFTPFETIDGVDAQRQANSVATESSLPVRATKESGCERVGESTFTTVFGLKW
jgi:hypothetical protein